MSSTARRLRRRFKFIDWPPRGAKLIRAGDSASFFHVRMSTSVPLEMNPSTNVTLLGDAIHAMTPTLGRGANLAMRDGALLGRVLKDTPEKSRSVAIALLSYELEMQRYGFNVVRESVELGRQRMGQNALP